MPPSVSIYGLTRRRDLATINDFIDNYVDRAASEDRGDEELMMEPLSGVPEDGSDWEPSISLTHIIERGLDQPPRAFANYLKPLQPGTTRAMICFTSDNQVVLGVHITYNYDYILDEVLVRGKKWLEEIVTKYDCHLGIIGEELVPPRSEEEFREAKDSVNTDLYKDYKPK